VSSPSSLNGGNFIFIAPIISEPLPRVATVRPSLCRSFEASPPSAAECLFKTTGVEAETIHRLLEVSPELQADLGRFTRNEAQPLKCGLLVVDETSMVDVVLMNRLLRGLLPNASLDRFLQQAEIIQITGRSYRLRHAAAANRPEKKAAAPDKPIPDKAGAAESKP